MLAQLIKFQSSLTEEDVLAVAHARAPEFRAIPALLQKYYLKFDEPNIYGGFYIWDSAQALAEYRQSELARTIPASYRIAGAPQVTVSPILFPLRD
ncbi:MAG: hypothetical protein KDJ90_18070 [Nitratireductor sp.]|nr:hypothetical protein [Nitratireductor sp.]